VSIGFTAGEEQRRARSGTLRQGVRREFVARQVAAYLPHRRAREGNFCFLSSGCIGLGDDLT